MIVRIYQIDLDKDKNGVAFEGYENLSKFQNSENIDSGLYNKVFDGDIDVDSLENVYVKFNIDMPKNYPGRALSVSDVVYISGSESINAGYYYCEPIGFKEVEFNPMLCGEQNGNSITVVVCEPGKKAYVKEISCNLNSYQSIVGGYIECYYPFESEDVIVCNDEGKLNGMLPNRGIYDERGELIDIIFGTFFVCDCSGEDFGSLNSDKQNEYLSKFEYPERFFRKNGTIISEKILG